MSLNNFIQKLVDDVLRKANPKKSKVSTQELTGVSDYWPNKQEKRVFDRRRMNRNLVKTTKENRYRVKVYEVDGKGVSTK